MNVREWLMDYATNRVKINMAEATGRLNANIEKLSQEKIILDIAIDNLPAEQLMAVDGHYRKGVSYAQIARQSGYAKATIVKRIKKGVDMLETVLK